MFRLPEYKPPLSYRMDLRERLTSAYLRHLLLHGTEPPSVFAFCESNGVSESDFYKEFSSFSHLESDYWTKWANDIIWTAASGSEYAGFTARQKFLTFGYVFFEQALDRRSLLLLRFGSLTPWCRPPWLAGFETRTKEHIRELIEAGIVSSEVASRGRLRSLYPDGLYLVFRGAVQYHLRDTSPGFERTDAFWEKSVQFAFDLMKSGAVDSAVDLARFLLPTVAGKATA
ncbi:MAG: hypothetical protein OHK005_18340 [Candidatus Methylacidiphilales bacterium]